MSSKNPDLLFITNIGHRDLTLDGAPLQKGELWEKAHELFKHVDDPDLILDFPIVRPCIDYILSRHDRIDECILIGTHQKDPHYHKSDTLNSARIIEKLLNKKYETKIQSIRLLNLDVQPNDYDEVYRWISNQIKKGKSFKTASRVFMLCSGGTPQANSALLFKGIAQLGKATRPIYVSDSGRVTELNLANLIQTEFNRKSAMNMCNRCCFEMIDQFIPSESPSAYLSRSASKWLHFDFTEALDELVRLSKKSPKLLRTKFEKIMEDFTGRRPKQNDPESNIRELFYNLAKYLEMGLWIDSLARMYRMYEAIVYLIADKILGLPHENSANKRERLKENFRTELTAKYPVMLDYLTQKKKDIYPSNEVIKLLFDKITPDDFKGEEKSSLHKADVDRCMEMLTELKDLRNRTIAAHDYQSVSKKNIADIVKKQIDLKVGGDADIPGIILGRIVSALHSFNIDIDPDQNTICKYQELIRLNLESNSFSDDQSEFD